MKQPSLSKGLPPPPVFKKPPPPKFKRPTPPADLELVFHACPFDPRFVETPDGRLQDRHLTPLGALVNIYHFWRTLPDVVGRDTIIAQCRLTLGKYAPESLGD